MVSVLRFSGSSKSRLRHKGEFVISVLKDYWELGIGKELILYLIEWAKENEEITKINLRVREDNIRGINLYKNLGFRLEGIVSRDFYIKGKYYKMPVYEMLGGKVRNKIRVYPHIDGNYPNDGNTSTERFVECALKRKKEGYVIFNKV